MKNIKLKSLLKEAQGVSYWKQYHNGGNTLKSELSKGSIKNLQDLVDARVEDWNDNNEDGKSNEVSKSRAKQIFKTAQEFFRSAGWISQDIVDAMIMQS